MNARVSSLVTHVQFHASRKGPVGCCGTVVCAAVNIPCFNRIYLPTSTILDNTLQICSLLRDFAKGTVSTVIPTVPCGSSTARYPLYGAVCVTVLPWVQVDGHDVTVSVARGDVEDSFWARLETMLQNSRSSGSGFKRHGTYCECDTHPKHPVPVHAEFYFIACPG